ncbi:hypothetical protein RchiOBHm_Chr6g0254991 [Rosa chinensis]|uniref:Uncharacterized protein n=1 Tax=Rosa chinensis TaxID=74649 RepID=A0A2P6PLR1_ROSCH|nr:hypothetical protein RchiOBHm_Chr6g0254991 [Rosa chinensis]
MVDKAGLARWLWIKFKDDSVFALYTPFFVGLAFTSLDSHMFLHGEIWLERMAGSNMACNYGGCTTNCRRIAPTMMMTKSAYVL